MKQIKEWVMMKLGIVSPSLLYSSVEYNERLRRVNPKRYKELVSAHVDFNNDLDKLFSGVNFCGWSAHNDIYADECDNETNQSNNNIILECNQATA